MLSLNESSLECILLSFSYYCDFVRSIMTVFFVFWSKWFLLARRGKVSLYQTAVLAYTWGPELCLWKMTVLILSLDWTRVPYLFTVEQLGRLLWEGITVWAVLNWSCNSRCFFLKSSVIAFSLQTGTSIAGVLPEQMWGFFLSLLYNKCLFLNIWPKLCFLTLTF